MREERKLKLKPKLTHEVKSAGSNPAPGIRAGVAQLVEAASSNLRLSLQTQHSPPSARSSECGLTTLGCGFEPRADRFRVG
jgi:hypothetical protein